METKDIIVLYHDKCLDGAGGAFAAWKKFGDSAAYLPVRRPEPPPEGLEGKEVYLIDFSYSQEILLEIERKAKRFVVLDHHVSAKEVVASVREHVFDLNRSGAGIAWNYFHPDIPLPKAIAYIQEIDIWQFSLPYHAEIRDYLKTVDLDFATLERLVSDFENEALLQKYIEKGKVYLDYSNYIKKVLAQEADLVKFEGYTIFALNAPGFFISDLGNFLARLRGPLGIVWYERGGFRKFGMRGDGSIDVSEIAKRYGGGGLHDAAGFRTSLDAPLPFVLLPAGLLNA